MGRSGRRVSGWAVIAAAVAASVTSSARAAPFHLPGRRPLPAIPTEGPWLVRAGATLDIYANLGKRPLPLQAHICLRTHPGGSPRVELQLEGRSPIDLQGCSSLYLLLGPGERIALHEPGPDDATGTYKLELSSPLK